MSDTPTSPARFTRDDEGLIVGLTYHYTPEGRIDWMRMLRPAHLFVVDKHKAAVVKAQGKPIDQCDLSLVDERWLRINQKGFNHLLNLRGYRSLDYHSLQVSADKAAVVCTIELIGNYETNGYPVICSAMASATTRSMDPYMMAYLEAFAENRSLARCVKRALQINVLSDDEIDAEALKGVKGEDDAVSDATSTPAGFNPYDKLRELCTARKAPISFDKLKASAIKHNAELTPDKEDERIQSDPATWTDWPSVQPIDAWLLIGKIKERDTAGTKGSPK